MWSEWCVDTSGYSNLHSAVWEMDFVRVQDMLQRANCAPLLHWRAEPWRKNIQDENGVNTSVWVEGDTAYERGQYLFEREDYWNKDPE